MRHPPLTSDMLLRAYAAGVFPMAESREADEVFMVDPVLRGILPLDGFHASRSLRRRILAAPFEVTLNRDFGAVVRGCADRPETWINALIYDLYGELHDEGHAHSVEVWQEDTLVGGVYGVTLGAAFFGESMFSRATDASKVALAYLVDRLRLTGFQLFDTQFITPHLSRLGAIEVPRAEYHERLRLALEGRADIRELSVAQTPQGVVQRITQTS